MINRYTTEGMSKIWSNKNKYLMWSMIEKMVSYSKYKLNYINKETFLEIEKTKTPTIEEIELFEKQTNHDLVAFIMAFTDKMSDNAKKEVHFGLTSSDVVDTAYSFNIVSSIYKILYELKKFSKLLYEKAIEYKNLPCIGRTHGIHAEPTVFGLKYLGWKAECDRNIKRLEEAKENISYGKISGAVGTYSQMPPEIEGLALGFFSLIPEPVSTQIIPRDRHAQVISTLNLIGGMIERIAFEIRSLQRSEVAEVEEGFSSKQIGSSAMPHKRNPILSERLSGMSRLLRGYSISAFEDMALWHERDISHSSVERVIIPDAFNITHYMLLKVQKLIKNLVVFENNVERNLNMTAGKIYSQNILGLLISKGYTRQDAYDIIKKITHQNVSKSYLINSLVSQCNVTEEELNKVMDVKSYLKNIDYIYERNK